MEKKKNIEIYHWLCYRLKQFEISVRLGNICISKFFFLFFFYKSIMPFSFFPQFSLSFPRLYLERRNVYLCLHRSVWFKNEYYQMKWKMKNEKYKKCMTLINNLLIIKWILFLIFIWIFFYFLYLFEYFCIKFSITSIFNYKIIFSLLYKYSSLYDF